ncbi:MAG: sugar kinase [Verrucomicrobiae bacterium]|nr:sugar kinase [Verrucomicrobiae bacterium]
MKRRTEKKIVVVTRETRIDGLRKRFTSVDQLSFFIEKRGGRVEDYLSEDQVYKESVLRLESELQNWGRVQLLDRLYLPNFVFGPEDTVVAIGQDGLVANTLKYLTGGQPLIGVNPDPDRWDGVLLPFRSGEIGDCIGEVLSGRFHSKAVTMALARLNDGQEILAVNDFFIGQRTHTSARYFIETGGVREQHSSSGIIVSTGLGSTGWLKSLIQGAASIAALTGHGATEPRPVVLPWDAESLYFTVREPFPSRQTQCDLVFGEVTREQPLRIRSLMADNGVLFSDGIESDFLEFNSGTEAEITIAPAKGLLVVR